MSEATLAEPAARIDISPREHEGDLLALETILLLHNRGQTCSSSTFCHGFLNGKQSANGTFDCRFIHKENV